ncbi:MAG TPA: hypothetical protein VF457_01160 [Burkholderiaceae bacterium]
MESRLLDSAAVPAWDDALMRMLARSSAPSVGPSHLAIGVEDASGRVYRVVQTSGVYETARVFESARQLGFGIAEGRVADGQALQRVLRRAH